MKSVQIWSFFGPYFPVFGLNTEMREKWPNTEFFLIRIFLYSVRILGNMDQKKLRIWTLFMQWIHGAIQAWSYFSNRDNVRIQIQSRREIKSSHLNPSIERSIQNSVKRLKWSFLQKIYLLFSQEISITDVLESPGYALCLWASACNQFSNISWDAMVSWDANCFQ